MQLRTLGLISSVVLLACGCHVLSPHEEAPSMSVAPLSACPRSLPENVLPDDARLGPLKDLDGVFPFTVPPSREVWEARAARVRRQLLVSLGLWPLPERTPLNAVIHGALDRGDYTVGKVYFESFPGFFVTGSLYRPKGGVEGVPAVLCPHGHWPDGRFHDAGEADVRKQIEQGGEQFAEGGRSALQARCVQLARMGCVAFLYDMIGYADSAQISFEVAHAFAHQRPEMNTLTDWGLYSPQAESHCQSVMGLQTWNSIRALDFLSALPGVDTSRLAVTGASGGGTQTFILCAIDPRPALAFPAVMVSTAMQGGCTCENACGLRVGTGNVELAALFAPKPLGVTSANDWTREMATKGFPELRQLYALMGAEDNVTLWRGERFDHNYNSLSRHAFYHWINRHFQLGLEEPIRERDYIRLSREEATVWDAAHPAPQGGADVERKLLRHMTDDAERQLLQASASGPEFRALCAPGWEAVVGRTLLDVGPVTWDETGRLDAGSYRASTGLLRHVQANECVPTVMLTPARANGRVVVWLTPAGKAGLFVKGDGTPVSGWIPIPQVEKLLVKGFTVVGADLLYQGEFLSTGGRLERTRSVANPREAGAYTFGYNPPLCAQRVHDVLTVLAYCARQSPAASSIDLVGTTGAGHWAAAAAAMSGATVTRLAVDTGGFRFGHILDLHAPDFLTGGANCGDVPGLLALRAPQELHVSGETPESLSVVLRQYALAAAAQAVEIVSEGAGGAGLVRYLTAGRTL